MNKSIILLTISILLLSCKTTKEETMWSKINNTTWNKKNSWTGENYVFYEDNKGNKKCLHQFMGSGVYCTSSNFVEVSFLDDYILKGNTLISKTDKTDVLTKIADTPNIYGKFSQLDIEDVKKDAAVIKKLFNWNELFDFEIFIFKKEDVADFKTENLGYGENWKIFLNKIALTKASLVLNSTDIEYYQWENQEIYLTEKATINLNNYKFKREYNKKSIRNDVFIVSLNRKPVYAGKFLNHMSAMAASFPVIYYDISPLFLRTFPVHSIYPYSELDNNIKNRTATKEIKEFFKNIDKLK